MSARDEIGELVGRFERCELDPAAFDHRAHLIVAAAFLLDCDGREGAAYERMRAALLAFLAHHKLDGYNDTITRFWMKYLAHRIAASPGVRPDALADAILAAGGGPPLLYAHFSKELVHGEAARACWVEPDLRPLEF